MVTPDLPGHGRLGDVEEARLEDVLDLVTGCVDGPFDLLGYSMGGRLALHCALALPDRVRRLILESASPGLATDRERALRRSADAVLAERLLTGGMAAFADEWSAKGVLGPGPYRDEVDQARVDAIRRAQRPGGLAAALRGLGTGSLPSLWARLARLRPPTGLIVGALDTKFEAIARRMATAIREPTLVVVPHAGHTVHLDRPDAWLTFVLGFLDDPPQVNEPTVGPAPRRHPP